MSKIDELVTRFLAWPLPDEVCADPCATQAGYPHRSGTNLLTAAQARQMLVHVLADQASEQEGEMPAAATSNPAIDRIDSAIKRALATEPAANVVAFVTGAFVGLMVELVRRNGHDVNGEIELDGGDMRDITIGAPKGVANG